MSSAGSRTAAAAIIAIALGFAAHPVKAQTTPPPPAAEEQQRQELIESWKAAANVAVGGPAAVRLGAQGQIDVPEKMVFVPLPEASRVMRALGNTVGSGFLGLVVSADDNDGWLATVSYFPEGYIRDDDAKDWNADDLYGNLKEGTDEGNKDRRERGFPELELLGWIEKPLYMADGHKLVWSIGLKDKGTPDTEERTVNYNTYVLGREGFFSLKFITNATAIESEKPLVRQLLSGLTFDAGKRYDDFNSSTDKVAAYGLAALVGGAVLKKAGLLAVIAAFAAKFAKLGILLIAGFFGGIVKFFRRKPKEEA